MAESALTALKERTLRGHGPELVEGTKLPSRQCPRSGPTDQTREKPPRMQIKPSGRQGLGERCPPKRLIMLGKP